MRTTVLLLVLLFECFAWCDALSKPIQESQSNLLLSEKPYAASLRIDTHRTLQARDTKTDDDAEQDQRNLLGPGTVSSPSWRVDSNRNQPPQMLDPLSDDVEERGKIFNWLYDFFLNYPTDSTMIESILFDAFPTKSISTALNHPAPASELMEPLLETTKDSVASAKSHVRDHSWFEETPVTRFANQHVQDQLLLLENDPPSFNFDQLLKMGLTPVKVKKDLDALQIEGDEGITVIRLAIEAVSLKQRTDELLKNRAFPKPVIVQEKEDIEQGISILHIKAKAALEHRKSFTGMYLQLVEEYRSDPRGLVLSYRNKIGPLTSTQIQKATAEAALTASFISETADSALIEMGVTPIQYAESLVASLDAAKEAAKENKATVKTDNYVSGLQAIVPYLEAKDVESFAHFCDSYVSEFKTLHEKLEEAIAALSPRPKASPAVENAPSVPVAAV